jgi:hypothetical protein
MPNDLSQKLHGSAKQNKIVNHLEFGIFKHSELKKVKKPKTVG